MTYRNPSLAASAGNKRIAHAREYFKDRILARLRAHLQEGHPVGTEKQTPKEYFAWLSQQLETLWMTAQDPEHPQAQDAQRMLQDWFNLRRSLYERPA